MDCMFMMQKYIYLHDKKTVLSKQDYLSLFFLFFAKLYHSRNQSKLSTTRAITHCTAYSMNRLQKKDLHQEPVQTIKLNPVPQDYPHYNPIWYNNQLHLLSQRGGLLYRVDIDSTIRLDKSFQHHKQFQSNDFVYRDTLFRYGGYGFWRANNFFTYFDHSTHEWEYYPTNGYMVPEEAYDGKTFLLKDTFYVLGGKTVNKSTGLSAEKVTKFGHLIFSNENGQIAEKWVLISANIRQYKKTASFFL